MKHSDNPWAYYDKIKDEQHVFIFSVCGRASSTAFQRLLNSSNSVWIWGERKNLVEQVISCIKLAKDFQTNPNVMASSSLMYESYLNNKHDKFYPIAMGNLESTILLLKSSIANLLKPWADVKRFGYKEIRISDISTLEYLKEIFPESFFLFCFRDPVSQWSSIKAANWKGISNDISIFLNDYKRIADIYITFASKYRIPAFIESENLRVKGKIQRILKYINISEIDYSLLNVTVSTYRGEVLETEKNKIMASEAYGRFLCLKKLSMTFFNDIEAMSLT